MKILVGMLVLASACTGADRVQLFNGKDLSGWEMVGPGRFLIEDGSMKTEGGMGLLWYRGRKFGNCTIRVVFRTASERANSGVIIRLPEEPPDPWYAVHNGYEIQINAGGDDWHSTGSIYSLSPVTARAQMPQGEWNTMEIHLKGPVTIISLNGKEVNRFDPARPVPPRRQWYEPVRGPRPDSGYLGLQNHDTKSVVYFKEVSVR
jgi:hypothetical protein